MKIGVSSYTFPWAIGVPGYVPQNPLTVLDLLDRARAMGVPVLQVADNLPLDTISYYDLDTLASRSSELGITIEVGTRGIATAHLARYVAIAQRLRSHILRVVIGGKRSDMTVEEVVSTLRPQRGRFQASGLILAIENYEAFTTDEFVQIVESIGTDWAGICLDTANSFGALEGPDVVVEKLGPYTVNVHLKDFKVRRADHMMGFQISGAPVGQGRLDVAWLFDRLGPRSGDLSAIIELWTPPLETVELTVQKERDWAEASVSFLRSLVGPPGFARPGE